MSAHRGSNGPPPPPVVDLEEQMVLRVPEHIATELRKMIRQAEERNSKNFDTRVAFALEATPFGGATFAFGKKKYAASLVNLPTVLESYKTNDNSNYYKSADVGQMLVVHDVEKGKGRARIHTDETGTINNGLCLPFKGLKKRFRRTYANKTEIAEVDNDLSRIKGGGMPGSVNIEVVEEDEDGELMDGTPLRTGRGKRGESAKGGKGKAKGKAKAKSVEEEEEEKEEGDGEEKKKPKRRRVSKKKEAAGEKEAAGGAEGVENGGTETKPSPPKKRARGGQKKAAAEQNTEEGLGAAAAKERKPKRRRTKEKEGDMAALAATAEQPAAKKPRRRTNKKAGPAAAPGTTTTSAQPTAMEMDLALELESSMGGDLTAPPGTAPPEPMREMPVAVPPPMAGGMRTTVAPPPLMALPVSISQPRPRPVMSPPAVAPSMPTPTPTPAFVPSPAPTAFIPSPSPSPYALLQAQPLPPVVVVAPPVEMPVTAEPVALVRSAEELARLATLQAQEAAIKAELANFHKQLAQAKDYVVKSINPVIRGRFTKQVATFSEKIASQEQALEQVQKEIASITQ